MGIEALKFGQSVAGLLIDGVEDTPYTGATLKLERPRGAVVEIPFIEQDEQNQFSHVSDWFNTTNPPLNMYLETPDGRIGLFGNHWDSHRLSEGVSLGKIRPREVLLGPCEAPFDTPLALDKVYSRIDGLQVWTGLQSVTHVPSTDSNGFTQSISVNAERKHSESWRQGDATLHFQSTWKTTLTGDGPESKVNINDGTLLVSSFPEERPFSEHLAEQRKVQDLFTLLFGGPIHFRQHEVSASSIVRRALSGEILHANPRIPMISADTVGESEKPGPSRTDLQRFLVGFEQIGTIGLERWASKYEAWERFILPAAAVLKRHELYMEDIIVSLSYSLEAAGHIIGKRPGEEDTYWNGRRPTTSTYVYRCLEALDVDWGVIAPSLSALAKALANAYNDIKHYDRGDFPHPEVQRVVSVVLQYVARLLALYIIADDGALLAGYRKNGALLRVHNIFERTDIRFDESGNTLRCEGLG